MLSLLRPRHVMPIHGEYRMLAMNAVAVEGAVGQELAMEGVVGSEVVIGGVGNGLAMGRRPTPRAFHPVAARPQNHAHSTPSDCQRVARSSQMDNVSVGGDGADIADDEDRAGSIQTDDATTCPVCELAVVRRSPISGRGRHAPRR